MRRVASLYSSKQFGRVAPSAILGCNPVVHQSRRSTQRSNLTACPPPSARSPRPALTVAYPTQAFRISLPSSAPPAAPPPAPLKLRMTVAPSGALGALPKKPDADTASGGGGGGGGGGRAPTAGSLPARRASPAPPSPPAAPLLVPLAEDAEEEGVFSQTARSSPAKVDAKGPPARLRSGRVTGHVRGTAAGHVRAATPEEGGAAARTRPPPRAPVPSAAPTAAAAVAAVAAAAAASAASAASAATATAATQNGSAARGGRPPTRKTAPRAAASVPLGLRPGDKRQRHNGLAQLSTTGSRLQVWTG